MPGQPQTLARTLFFPANTAQPTFSSFKSGESKPGGLESSVIHSLDSSSVLSHLLKDSLMTKLEPGLGSETQQGKPPAVDENLNICKYYF